MMQNLGFFHDFVYHSYETVIGHQLLIYIKLLFKFILVGFVY